MVLFAFFVPPLPSPLSYFPYLISSLSFPTFLLCLLSLPHLLVQAQPLPSSSLFPPSTTCVDLPTTLQPCLDPCLFLPSSTLHFLHLSSVPTHTKKASVLTSLAEDARSGWTCSAKEGLDFSPTALICKTNKY